MADKLTIRQMRLVREMSQAELAARVGVHVNTIVNWEKNPGCIDIEHAMRLCGVFNCSINDLLFSVTQNTTERSTNVD